MTAPGSGGEQGLPAPADVAPAWADLAGGLPTHSDEVMASHTGRPTVAEQNRTHGAGLPAEDHGC